MNEPKLYYSEDDYQEMLEVSDRPMLWYINCETAEKKGYYTECNAALRKLSEHYHTEVGCCGRSGRHVCVPDTPANRRNYRHIVAAVKREQDRIIKMFS